MALFPTFCPHWKRIPSAHITTGISIFLQKGLLQRKTKVLWMDCFKTIYNLPLQKKSYKTCFFSFIIYTYLKNKRSFLWTYFVHMGFKTFLNIFKRIPCILESLWKYSKKWEFTDEFFWMKCIQWTFKPKDLQTTYIYAFTIWICLKLMYSIISVFKKKIAQKAFRLPFLFSFYLIPSDWHSYDTLPWSALPGSRVLIVPLCCGHVHSEFHVLHCNKWW